MEKILIVDDDQRIRTMVRTYAEAKGYACVEAHCGDAALDALERDNFDIVVLDVMMPGMDGFTVLSEIRQGGDTPVIMLTARDEEYDRLKGFELGADDYVSKPFSPRELVARIDAVLKRSGAKSCEVLRFGSLEIDRRAHSVILEGEELALTPKEYDLLLYMASNVNIALSRERLLKNVWGYDHYGNARTVDTHIRFLRERLGSHQELIVTVRNVGYKFDGRWTPK